MGPTFSGMVHLLGISLLLELAHANQASGIASC
jgi:hypothetical protein